MKTIQPRKKIVVAEDELVLLKALTLELTKADFDVYCATNGEAVIDAVVEQKPDLLILDILMPKLNGLDALEKIRKHRAFKRMPAIVLSNLSQEEEMQRAKDLGVVRYFIKATIDLEEVIRFIRGVLGLSE